MATNLSIRLNDQDEARLDRLVIACRAYYKGQPAPFSRLADDVTRSSAMRDLLLAWEHGVCDQFSREITDGIADG